MVSTTKTLYEGDRFGLTPSNNWSTVPADQPIIVDGFFQNDSTNNHWYRDHRKGETYDRGSNWTAFESSLEKSPIMAEVVGRFGIWFGYKGPLFVHSGPVFTADDYVALFDGWSSLELDLFSLGSTAISKVIPTNPISDVPTAVAEILGEGIGIPGSSLLRGGNIARRTSGEYLNHVFGTLPLLSDIQKFAKATRRAEELIDRYASNSGKLIRRRYDFPVLEETSEEVLPDPGSSLQWFGSLHDLYMRDFLTPAYGGLPGTKTVTVTKSKKTWYKGAFTYYLPKVGSSVSSRLEREEAELRYLYGGISANTAWELLPYSWAVDWMTNAGDIIHNVNAFAQDGLVMPWGYIMERCELRESRTVVGAVFGRQDPNYYYDIPGPVTDVFSAKFLRRRKATPFGFGLDVDGFTNRQKSILVALGINKIF